MNERKYVVKANGVDMVENQRAGLEPGFYYQFGLVAWDFFLSALHSAYISHLVFLFFIWNIVITKHSEVNVLRRSKFFTHARS